MNFISMCCFNVNRPDPDEPQPKKKKLVFLILLPCKSPWQLYYHVSRNVSGFCGVTLTGGASLMIFWLCHWILQLHSKRCTTLP